MSSTTMDKLGRYEILEELGRGAMGTVYRARDPKIGRIVAIKTILAFGAHAGKDDEYRQRFFREAQAAGNLSHPGIVTIHDVGEEETTKVPYIVMEYIAGRTLENLMTAEDSQRPSVEVSLDLVRQLAEALDYAHSQNIVHRDIKPANIMVTPEGRAKITDFGVARLTHSEFTVQGQLIGTPAYMPPEQLKGDPVDGRSDLFSLGVILYWLLTGEKPFAGDATTVIAKILYREPAPVTHFNPSLGPEYDRMVSRALAKEPAARFQRGKEFAEELGYLRAGQTPPHRPNPVVDARSKVTLPPWSPGSTVLEKTLPLDSAGPSTLPTPQQASQGRGGSARKSLTKLAVIGITAMIFFSALLFRTMNDPSPRVNKSVVASKKSVATTKRSIAATNKAAPSVSVLPARESSDTPARKPSESATLQILCWHDFDSAELSVWVDNDLVYETKLEVTGKRISGYHSATVYVPSGKRTVRVQVKSNRDSYNETRTIDADLVQAEERTLEITCNEFENDFHLAWQN